MAPTAPPRAPRDDLCLDSVNTRYWRGSEAATETLAVPADLLAWTSATGGARPAIVEALRARWRNSPAAARSEEHTSELQSLMRISYAVFCLEKQPQAHIPTAHISTTTNNDKA